MRDREILRGLAGEIAAIAALDAQDENRALHRAVNSLRMIRPVVLINELPWNQLNGDGALTPLCEDEQLRGVETRFRRTLFQWRNFPADMIVEPFYRLRLDVRYSPIGVSVEEDTLADDSGNSIVSHRYTDQFPDEASLEKLLDVAVTVDREATERARERLHAIFGDILPVRVTGEVYAGHFAPWDDISMWRGVEPVYMDMVDRPELLHALMRRLVDIRLNVVAQLEKLGALDPDTGPLHCTPALVDELPTKVDGPVTRANIWGRGMAQMFASVSPAMHDEFEIAYMREFFAGFGLVYYGCCEPLDKKIDIVRKLPNLRKISITPWANVRNAAEQMGGRYVLARKPNPAAVAVATLDEDALRADILETLSACRDNGTPCDFVLKDISSCGYNPNTLVRWERVVMETVRGF